MACACAPSVFLCQDDASCPNGQCEASGFCSFPDPACDSGRRYGEFAGDGLGGACVADPESETDTDPTTGLTTALPASTTLEGDESSSSSSSGSPPPDSESSGSPFVCPEDWWDCAWERRQRITVEPMPLAEPVEQLPVAIRLDPTLLRDSSLRLLDAAGELIPWERDDELLWVGVNLEPDEAVNLWAYGGNADAPPVNRSPKVWDTAYAAVWHLSSGGDATGFGNVASSESVSHDAGYFGRAGHFDGMADKFDVLATDPLADLRDEGFTVEVLINPDDLSTNGFRRIVDKSDSTTSTLGWAIMLAGDAPTHYIEVNYGLEMMERQTVSESFDVNDWAHLVVITQPGDETEFWLDGQPLGSSVQDPGLGTATSDALQAMTIGAPTAGDSPSRFFHGAIDELRISRGIRSPSWVLGAYTAGLPDAISVDAVEDLLE